MRIREAALRARAAPQRDREPRLRCVLRVCPGYQHSDSTPTQPFGHAPLPPELEIAIFAAAAP
eukprot:3527322-Prymnesium_polylepis.1